MNYYSLNNYLKDTFHTKVYKISINAGFTCPNRDGTLDTRGCIFCSGAGSGDFSGSSSLSISEQIEEGKKRVASKIGNDGKYIAYFQAFTNTYAPVEKLRTIYEEAINHPDIVAISIGTRPDCLPPDVLDLLEELNRLKPVWVELGLQTIHENTAGYIRRCYPLETYDDAMKELKKRGITVITHIILGLPGESEKDMLESVKYVVNSGIDGIKLQLLHVLKNTDLAKDYEIGKFECLEMDEYISLVVKCLEIIPDNIVIHRMTGDGDKKILIAPEWSGDKKHVLNALTKAIQMHQSSI
ncbi:MAG: TIGR01212 family radical SAM protein [Lachnospiraceae bacterium]|nr:TIGR01212 family radical SAM protein [Lachnospiraceae bacterium]